MKKIVSILIFIVALIFIGRRIYQYPEKQDIKRINQLYYSKDLEKAKKELEIHLKKYPASSQAWSYLGLVNWDLEDVAGAEAAYKKAIALDGENDKALVGLGIIAREKRDYTGARQYYERAQEVKPNNPDIYASLMVIEMKNKNYAKAVELGEKAKDLDLKKRKPGILANLVLAYHMAHRVKERDETLAELKRTDYPDVKYVEMIINGEIDIAKLL